MLKCRKVILAFYFLFLSLSLLLSLSLSVSLSLCLYLSPSLYRSFHLPLSLSPFLCCSISSWNHSLFSSQFFCLFPVTRRTSLSVSLFLSVHRKSLPLPIFLQQVSAFSLIHLLLCICYTFIIHLMCKNLSYLSANLPNRAILLPVFTSSLPIHIFVRRYIYNSSLHMHLCIHLSQHLSSYLPIHLCILLRVRPCIDPKKLMTTDIHWRPLLGRSWTWSPSYW